jgi:hypothetical protein
MKKPKQFVHTNTNNQNRQVSKNNWIYDNTEEYDIDDKKISHKFEVILPCNIVFFFSIDKIKTNSAQQKIN